MALICQMKSCYAKGFLLFVAVVILLQGICYLGLSLFGLLHTRDIKPGEANPLGLLFHLIYFYVPSTINLGNLTITVNDDNNNNIKLRTFGILISYSVISTLWILLSLVVLTCVCVPFTSRVAKIYFWPWFISIVLGSVLDMIATVFHIFDILHTTSLKALLIYIGATMENEEISGVGNDFIFAVPAVVMACLSSRFVLIWLFNICASSFCVKLSQVLALNPKKATPKTTSEVGNENRSYRRQQKDKPAPCTEDKHLNTSFVATEQCVSYTNSYNSLQDNNNRTPNTTASISSLLNHQQKGSDFMNDNSEAISYRNIDTHPDRLNYPLHLRSASGYPQGNNLSSNAPSLIRYVTSSTPRSPQAVVTPQINAATTNRNAITSLYPFNLSPTEEIKGHLPWTYINNPSRPSSSNQQLFKRTNSEYYMGPPPSIPDPDYDN